MKYGITVLCVACVIIPSTVEPISASNPDIYDDIELKQEMYDSQWALESEIQAEIESELEGRIQRASVTVLMDAAKSGTPADIRKLIKDGEYIHAKDYDGKTALSYAAEYNTPEVVQTLIDAGAYVSRTFILEFTNGEGEFFRERRGIKHPEVFKILVKAGADVNAKDDDGRTALMLARNPKIIKALIMAGANINATDKEGKTALIHIAGDWHVSEKAVNALIDARADINIKDNSGKTALDYAKRSEISNDTLKRLGASWYDLHWF